MTTQPPLRPDQMAPHSVEAEEAFLGSALLNPDVLDDVQQVEPDDFFIVRNAWVWEAIRRLDDRNEAIDYITVVEELRHQGRLEEIGGAAYITYLINHTPSSIYAETYGHMVMRTKVRRDTLDAASQIARLAHEESQDIFDVIDDAEAALEKAWSRLPDGNSYLSGREALAYYAAVMKQRTDPAAPTLLTFPFECIAPVVPGVKAGKVVLVTGFSGEGKTLLLEGLMDWWAMLGNKMLYVTTELTREDMLDRMVCRHTALPYGDVIAKTANAKAVISRFGQVVKTWLPNIDFWETNGASARTVYRQIKRAIERGRKIIFIDYLGEAIGFDPNISEKVAIDNFFRKLHTLAKTTGAWIVVASQLTETDFGPRAKGSRVPHEKSALHIRLETEKAKETRVYSIDNRLITVEARNSSPFITLVFEKNTFGPAPKKGIALFKDGARFRFLDSRYVNWGSPAKREKTAPVESDALVEDEDKDDRIPF